MGCYSHLSDDEREQIGLAEALGHSIGAIAQAIGRPKSTVWRELCRNRLPSGRYSPLHAAGAYQLRRRREAPQSGLQSPQVAQERRSSMTNGSSLSLAELEQRIAIARDNIRQLIEQAAALSGAEDEDRNADRIAQQQEELDRLIKQRELLLKK